MTAPANLIALALAAGGAGANPIVWNSISASNSGNWGKYTANQITGSVTTSGGGNVITALEYNYNGGAWTALPAALGTATVNFNNVGITTPPLTGNNTLNVRATDTNGNKRVASITIILNQDSYTWTPSHAPDGTPLTLSVQWSIPNAAVVWNGVKGPSGTTQGPTSAGNTDSNGTLIVGTGNSSWGGDTSEVVYIRVNGTLFATVYFYSS